MNHQRILSAQDLKVYLKGLDVVLAVGNAELPLDADTAYEVAVALRLKAKKAKRLAGQPGGGFRMRGVLTDAEDDVREEQAARVVTATFIPRMVKNER